jgi:signal transduction histidine kinase
LGQTYYFVRNDGSKFAAGITASPFVLDGRIVGVILVFRDVSREKDIDQAKTEFVSLASHQLRTPLSTISWYAEMLLTGDAGKVNKEQKEYLEEIYKGNQRMVELVNALLNVSRIELGTFSVEPEDTDLREVAESVFDELKPQLLQKKMKVVHEYDAKLTNIYLDKKLIRIVFQNLLTNALKYTPAKGQIELRIVKQKSDVMVSVKDNGCGIPKKDQKQIFQKLFRADNVKTLDTNGTGLGLYIVRSIVEQSAGGKIWFESTEGKGTTFFVTLPLKGMKPKEGSRALT